VSVVIEGVKVLYYLSTVQVFGDDVGGVNSIWCPGNKLWVIGIIFQQSTLFPWLTVRGNIEFALKVRGLDRGRRSEIADQLIRLVNLDSFSSVRPSGLSGGMAQRASLARALATEPEVLLLDEPFSSLDAVSRLKMHEVLLRVWERLRMSIVFVTHDVDEAVALGDRIVIMTRRPGRIAAEVNVNLPRPRVQGGIRCAGFEDIRNHIASLAQDLYAQES
jgi:NitT/TauT family transport system ATP-binding protein